MFQLPLYIIPNVLLTVITVCSLLALFSCKILINDAFITNFSHKASRRQRFKNHFNYRHYILESSSEEIIFRRSTKTLTGLLHFKFNASKVLENNFCFMNSL